jgi:hypothetical protein
VTDSRLDVLLTMIAVCSGMLHGFIKVWLTGSMTVWFGPTDNRTVLSRPAVETIGNHNGEPELHAAKCSAIQKGSIVPTKYGKHLNRTSMSAL